MAGQEDWEQISINGYALWGHKPCGQVIMVSATSLHAGLCPATTEKAPTEDPEA